jgi:peptide/nickel transport system permease protein
MSEIAAPPDGASEPDRTFVGRLRDNDLLASFLASKVTVAAGIVTIILFLAALLAPWVAPTDPFNPATNYLSDSLDPPSFVAGGDPRFLLGTDDQGRDLMSAILYGLRVSLAIGLCSVALGAAIGVSLGLIAGYAGGWIDSAIMRIAGTSRRSRCSCSRSACRSGCNTRAPCAPPPWWRRTAITCWRRG